jgi:hypothetical protein
VGLTRGRDENHAYVICSRPEGADRDGPSQDPLAVLAAIVERDDNPIDYAALAVQAEQADTARSLKTLFPIWQDLISIAGTGRWAGAVTGACGTDIGETMLSSPAWPTLAARLRTLDAAGMNSGALLGAVARSRAFDDADDIAAVLHWRLAGAELNARLVLDGTFSELSAGAAEGDLGRAIGQVAAAMDARIDWLGQQAKSAQPAWAAQLGSLPDSPEQAADWCRRAGIVAGYQEAFGIETDGTDPIGDRPATTRPDAAAWWQRAAAALDRTEPASLAQLPDEHLEALIDEARRAETAAPPAISEHLQQLHVQLRETRTAEGLARQAGHIDRARQAHQQAERLAKAVLQAEEGHRGRQEWRTGHARLADQAKQARSELDLRALQRSATRLADVSLAGLRRQAANAKTRLVSMEETLQDIESLDWRYDRQLDRLNTEMSHLFTSQPATAAAQRRIRDEQQVADRIDELEYVLAQRRLGVPTERPSQRIAYRQELHRLLDTYPQLAVPKDRQRHWDHIASQAHTRDAASIENLRGQITQVQARKAENMQIIGACQTEHHRRASHYQQLNSALEARSQSSPPQPHHGWEEATAPGVRPNPNSQLHLPALDIEPPAPSGPSITP